MCPNYYDIDVIEGCIALERAEFLLSTNEDFVLEDADWDGDEIPF